MANGNSSRSFSKSIRSTYLQLDPPRVEDGLVPVMVDNHEDPHARGGSVGVVVCLHVEVDRQTIVMAAVYIFSLHDLVLIFLLLTGKFLVKVNLFNMIFFLDFLI